jgi:OOP family OmpA-OmpF porin
MFKTISAAAVFALVSGFAFAAPPQPFYAGGDIGTTKVDGDSHRETGFGGFVGYKLNDQFAIEAGYRRLADTDIGNVGSVSIDQASVSVVGTYPLSNGFSVFGRVGYNRVKAKYDVEWGTGPGESMNSSVSESHGLYGIGLGYAFSPTISGRIEVQRPTSDSTNLSAGVAFSF